MFGPTVQRLVDAFHTGREPLSSGHDYRQALELAIALKISAAEGHRRVHLPLENRAVRAYPHLYRLNGGDKAGWQSIGYGGPPSSQREKGGQEIQAGFGFQGQTGVQGPHPQPRL